MTDFLFYFQLTEDAGQHLIDAYVEMRRIGNRKGQVSAYPRQLESLIRLSEAHAKVRLSDTVRIFQGFIVSFSILNIRKLLIILYFQVQLVDVEEAKRLHREALKQSAVDPSTGKIDVGIISTGMSNAGRQRKMEIASALKKLLDAKNAQTHNYNKILQDFKDGSQFVSKFILI